MLQPDAISANDKNITKKSDYSSPTLVCYGSVAELTLAGGSRH